MINAIITKLNSQLPDATITVENIIKQCYSRDIEIQYTIHNVNSTEILPAGTTVGIYVDSQLVAVTQTVADIPIGGSESGTVTITVPAATGRDFELFFFVDHLRTVTETNEDNNTLTLNETLWLQDAPTAADIHACQTVLGSHRGIFDFSGYAQSLMGAPGDVVTFYRSQNDAQTPRTPISLTEAAAFLATANPQEIYVRVEDENGCTAFTSFTLITDDCLYPDATVSATALPACGTRDVAISLTVSNTDGFAALPAGTPINIYVGTVRLTTAVTTAAIPIGGSQTLTVNVTIPAGVQSPFDLNFIVDENNTIIERNETNNSFILPAIQLRTSPTVQQPLNLSVCETTSGSNIGIFDFSAYEQSLKNVPTDVIRFYTTQNDAILGGNNFITDPENYTSNGTNPQTIYVRLQDANGCYAITQFLLNVRDCLFPDATITATNLIQACDSRSITVTYTVSNLNSFDVLPAGTTIGIYANTQLISTTATAVIIPVGGSEQATVTLTIPTGIPLSFDLIFRVDIANTVEEISETNNSFTLPVQLWVSPTVSQPQNITECETANNSNIGIFDFSAYEQSLKNNPTDVVRFYTTQNDALLGGNNNITNPENYTSNGANPQTIYVRLQDVNGCFGIATFSLIAIDCLFPDATVTIDEIIQQCDSRDITVVYTVHNFNSFDILPLATPVAFYTGSTLLGLASTVGNIPVNGSLTAVITLSIPAGIPLNFNLVAVADDNGTGTGVVVENDETNNSSAPFAVSLWVSPVLRQPANITACETFNGSGVGSFDFSAYEQSLKNTPTDVITFHATQQQAINGTDDITLSSAYIAPHNTQIFVRLEDVNSCYDVKPFTLIIIDCYFPDATVVIEEVYKQCNSRIIHVHYHVSNLNGTDVLPASTPVAIYVNGNFLDYTETIEDIAIGESESNYITLTIPIGVPLDFDLTFVADDTGDGTGIVIETDENNNSYTLPTTLVLSPVLQQPDDITSCDKGYSTGAFDFSDYAESLKNYPNETVTFYRSQQSADQAIDPIYNTTQFVNDTNPQRIFVRLDNGTCHTTASFLLRIKKCAPTTYNYVTPNGDGYNDTFFVEGLRNIFLNFKMNIYNRWGNLVWTGDHNEADWNGIADVQKVGNKDTTVPTGTYYFVLELNDPDFPEPIVGWVYVTQ
nr:CARDB domain-containing protein [Flavobacterium sp. Sd200]